MRVYTEDELRYIFGDPAPYIDDTGEISPAWEMRILRTIHLPKPLKLAWGGEAKTLRCHHLAMGKMTKVLSQIHLEGLWSWLEPFGGCYMFRPNKNAPGRLSSHAWGIALDVRVDKNPNKSKKSDQHPRVVQILREHGFVWGGDTPELQDPDKFDTDPMHFEIGVDAPPPPSPPPA